MFSIMGIPHYTILVQILEYHLSLTSYTHVRVHSSLHMHVYT